MKLSSKVIKSALHTKNHPVQKQETEVRMAADGFFYYHYNPNIIKSFCEDLIIPPRPWEKFNNSYKQRGK